MFLRNITSRLHNNKNTPLEQLLRLATRADLTGLIRAHMLWFYSGEAAELSG